MKPSKYIRVISNFATIKIYIHGILHVSVPRDGLTVTSWVTMGDSKWVIEYNGSVATEYDSEAKWIYILSELDKVL